MLNNIAVFWNRIGWKMAYAAIVIVWLIMMVVIFGFN